MTLTRWFLSLVMLGMLSGMVYAWPEWPYDDGDADQDDVDLLCANVGGSDLATFDLDKDGDIDEDDQLFLIEQLLEYDLDGDYIPDGVGSKRGDFNLDGVVNATDLAIQKVSFGPTGEFSYRHGNANCDSTVNGTDLAILRDNFGWTPPGGGEAVPEPASIGLLLSGGVMLLRRKR